MDSEVGNKALLRAIADLLQIEDVKRFASDLATERIIPVASVVSPIASPQFRYQGSTFSQDVTGLSTFGSTIVSCGESEIARVLTFEVSVASPTAFGVPATIGMQGFYSLDETGVKVFHLPDLEEIGAAVQPWEAMVVKGGFQCRRSGSLEVPQPATIDWHGLVPPNKSFSIQVDSSANFPANSVGIIRALYAIGPAPFQPPL